MNLDDDDDSVFEQALRADLPSIAEQNRLRPRILAAGVAVGTALGSTNVAAATQASFGASALSKLSALSWPAKLGLAAVLSAPVAALPLVYAPVRGADLVSQVRTSAATVRARSAANALSPSNVRASEAPQTAQVAPEPTPAPAPEPANVIARAPVLAVSNLPTPAALAPSPAASDNASTVQPAVATFGHESPPSEVEAQRSASTLAAETQLLDRAFAALAAGDRSTAAALVAEHARRFPNGLLRQERERARTRLAADPKGE